MPEAQPRSGESWHERDLFNTLAKVLYLAAALAILIWFLYLIEQILLASLLALILSVALNVPVSWLEDRNVPRAAGTLLSFLAVLAISGLVGWLWRYTDRLLGALALGLFVIALALYMIVNLRSLLGWYLRSMPPRL